MRKIIIGGIGNNDMDALQRLKLPDDKNILATFHFYEPFEFSHQGADWVEGADAWLGATWQGNADEKQAIASRLDQAASWSEEHRIPLILGEFGAINQADAASRQQWMGFVAREAEKRNIGWVYWEFCSQFGVYDCATRLWHGDLLKALIPE
jgi:endoglucanase